VYGVFSVLIYYTIDIAGEWVLTLCSKVRPNCPRC
jgi:hypothetical protein